MNPISKLYAPDKDRIDVSHKDQTVKAAGIVSFATLLSRISGLFRMQAIAALVSVHITDVFYFAFKIPNFLRAITAEGSLSSGFIPVFNESLVKDDREKSLKFFSAIFTILVIVTLIISIIGIIAAPLIIKIAAWGWSISNPENLPTAASLLKIMFPFVLFISIAALFMGTLNSLRHFFIPALSSAFLNISMILGLVIGHFVLDQPLYGLAWGVILGGLLQSLSQLVVLFKKKFVPNFNFHFFTPEVKKVFLLVSTAALGSSVIQVNTGIDNFLATFLESGSVSYLAYGNLLFQFPLAFFATSFVIAIFPSLARSASSNNIEELKSKSKEGLDLIMFMIFPAMATLLVLSQQIVDLLLKHGIFGNSDLIATSTVIICYTLGLWSISGGKLYVRIFHSLQDMKTPVKIGIYGAILNFILNVVLMQFISFAGLALSTTLSQTFQLYLLSKHIEKKIGRIKDNFFDKKYLMYIGFSIIMALFFNFTAEKFYMFDSSFIPKGFHLFWILSSGWLIYFLLSFIFGIKEPKQIFLLLSRKKG